MSGLVSGTEHGGQGVPGQRQGSQTWWQKCTKGTRELWSEVKAVNSQPMYLANNWGFVPVQAALGVFTFWGPKASALQRERSRLAALRTYPRHQSLESKVGCQKCCTLWLGYVQPPHLLQSQFGEDVGGLASRAGVVQQSPRLWRLQAAKAILKADDDTVSSLLGGLVLGTGVIGTLGGGMHPTATYQPYGDRHPCVCRIILPVQLPSGAGL